MYSITFYCDQSTVMSNNRDRIENHALVSSDMDASRSVAAVLVVGDPSSVLLPSSTSDAGADQLQCKGDVRLSTK